MIPSWIDRTAFCVTPADLVAFDDAARLGFNAVCFTPNDAMVADDATRALIDAAHRKELRVCIDLTCIEQSQNDVAASRWDGVGADALKLRGTSARARACIVAEQHSIQPGVVSYLDTTLFRSPDGHAYFDGHGNGDFAEFWQVFGPAHRAFGANARVALGTAEAGRPSLRVGRELDDLEVIHTFLLTWPIVPFIASGDEGSLEPRAGARIDSPERRASARVDSPEPRAGARIDSPERRASARVDSLEPRAGARIDSPERRAGARIDSPERRAGARIHSGAAFERMLYLRLTEGDLAPDATLELLSPPSPGYPLLYRRGGAIVVALNPGATAHRVDLESVGDAAPLVARHCHLAHTDGRWTARLGPAGYGVFNVA